MKTATVKTYLAALPAKPDAHKKRFALAVSGGVTLCIFGVWAFVNYGLKPATLAQNTTGQSGIVSTAQTASAINAVPTVTPFEALGGNIGDAWGALKTEIGTAIGSLRSADLEAQYTQVRNEAVPATMTNNGN